jgi:16S rRNA (cytosine1402-N4)-methyltransferase
MLEEALDGLDLTGSGCYVDCTFGRGGHSRAILAQLGGQGQLLAIDKDRAALASPEAQLLGADPRFRIEQASFAELGRLADELGWRGRVDGVLLDLGVSSPQLDQPERGFSFMRDGPLDMRMDCGGGVTAADWLAAVGEQELSQVLRDYGEERHARRIARAVVAQRSREPLVSTRQLAGVIAAAVPRWERGQHPATRSFQAIRIVINRELSDLQECLAQAVDVLAPGGRIAVIAFHSLEDRIVKRFIRDQSRSAAEEFWPGAPQPSQARLRKLGGPRRPGDAEVRDNPRSRSAILRLAERMPV